MTFNLDFANLNLSPCETWKLNVEETWNDSVYNSAGLSWEVGLRTEIGCTWLIP